MALVLGFVLFFGFFFFEVTLQRRPTDVINATINRN